MPPASRALVAAFPFFLLLLLPLAAFADPPERSISVSRQFLVYGSDVHLRGAICALAEGAKKNVLLLLGERDAWTTPIIIRTQPPQTNLPENPRSFLSFSQTGAGLKLQLDLTINSDLSAPAIEREILRAVLLELMYRNEPELAAGTVYVEPPDWLLEGLIAIEAGRGLTPLVEGLEAARGAGKTLSLAEFLQEKPRLLAAPARSLYRAYSFALVSLLVSVPDGRRALTRFIGDLRFSANDPMADLQSHFPQLLDDSEKTWRSHIAQLLHNQPSLFSAAETETGLEALVRLKITEGGSTREYRLEEFPLFLPHPSSKIPLLRLNHDLLIFATHANHLYRPIVAEYAQIIATLHRGKTRRIAERLARLRGLRMDIARRTRAIDDYMNWFEATKSRTPSGVFSDYAKTVEAARLEPRKRDPISIYLDALETQLQH
jgi:hypothetical protein